MNLKLENSYNEKIKETRGITLIALVVTIVILLILARNINIYANRAKPE